MSERGVFAVDRGVWDHPMFAPEPFTEREAWLWMVSAAAWVAKRVRVGRAQIDLQRGQLAFATRFLATKWKWAHSKVVRFLKRLETDTMVTTLATRETTLITICNYDKYAFGRNTTGTQSDTPTETLPERQRNKEEEPKKDNNKEVSKKETRDLALSSAEPSDFDAFWDEWPNKVGKPAALKAFNSAIKRGAGLWDIQDGMRSYIREKPPDRSWLNPATFLNQDRWKDQPATVQGSSNGRRTVHDAANDLDRHIKSLQEPAPDGLCGGTGQGPLRLISPR